MKNLVNINIGSHGNSADLPQPGKPVITVNGVPIDSLFGIVLEAGANEMTKVTLAFYAKVEGEFVVEDEALKFADREDFNRMMKEAQA